MVRVVGCWAVSYLFLIQTLSPSEGVTNFTACGTNCSTTSGSSTTRNILYVSAYCNGENFDAGGVLKVVEETVNSSERFNLGAITTGPTSKDSVGAFLQGFVRAPLEFAVIHPGCFNNNVVLADISQFFNSTLITFAFSRSSSFPHSSHVQILPSETHLGLGVVAILRYYGWKTMHAFTEDAPSFQNIMASIQGNIQRFGATVNITQSVILYGNTKKIEFPSDSRIILLNMFPREAIKIICEMWNQNISYFHSTVWITYEWHIAQWWTSFTDICDVNKVEEALTRMLIVSNHPIVEEDEDSEEFSTIYERYAVDTVLTLEAVLSRMESLDDRNFIELVNSISFNGSSGLVKFENGIRQLDIVSIKVYREGQLITIALVEVRGNQSFVYVDGESNDTVWPAGIPWDGEPIQEINAPLLPLLVLCYFYSSMGILFALVCLIFNIIFRKKKLIQLTSPNLNYVIIIGAIVMQCSAYTFFHLPKISDQLLAAVCNLRMILLAIGFTLCYMPINAKMWRVFHICRKPNPTMKKLFIKDWHLILLVMIILAVEVVFLAILTSIPSVRYTVSKIPDKEHPGCHTRDDGITVKFYVRRCYTDEEIIFIPIFIGTKFIIQIIGVFLAFSIQKVKIKGLNDAQEVSAILYVTTALTFIMAVIIFIFGDYINIDGATYGFGATTATYCVLGLIFIPKMISLYKDPKGEKIFTKNDTHVLSQTGNDQKMVINAYEKRIKELESQLSENKTAPLDITNSSSDADKTDSL